MIKKLFVLLICSLFEAVINAGKAKFEPSKNATIRGQSMHCQSGRRYHCSAYVGPVIKELLKVKFELTKFNPSLYRVCIRAQNAQSKKHQDIDTLEEFNQGSVIEMTFETGSSTSGQSIKRCIVDDEAQECETVQNWSVEDRSDWNFYIGVYPKVFGGEFTEEVVITLIDEDKEKVGKSLGKRDVEQQMNGKSSGKLRSVPSSDVSRSAPLMIAAIVVVIVGFLMMN